MRVEVVAEEVLIDREVRGELRMKGPHVVEVPRCVEEEVALPVVVVVDDKGDELFLNIAGVINSLLALLLVVDKLFA